MLRLRIALALLLLFSAAASAQQQDLDTALSAVVRISGTRDGSPVRGSGFVVGLAPGKATIVTASHVIEGVQKIQVIFAADRTASFPAGAVLGLETGSPHGLAVFQVRGSLPTEITTLSFEIERRPRIGDAVFLLGFPQMALVPRTAQRVLSARNGTLLLIDQDVGEGFSGGPVLQGGKVVGVVTDTDDQTTFAVNALVAHEALEGWRVAVPQAKPEPPVIKACVAGEQRTENGIDFVRICPGIFIMGSSENAPQAAPDERPAHLIELNEFWIGKTEITNAQYHRFEPSHQIGDERPVTSINWTRAMAACEYFGGRLPTEAEWEYAARAGSEAAWFSDEKVLAEYAWYAKNAGDTTHPVAKKRPNAWGLYDMHGNVSEWVADRYGFYGDGMQIDPTGPQTGQYRVVRGGSFDDPANFLTSARRSFSMPVPVLRGWEIGFRCAHNARRQP